MKKLILLDRKFPFKSGEAFLENEINSLTKYFDEIYIYPSDVGIKDKQTREINSDKVKLRVVEKKDYSKRKISYILSSFKYFFTSKEKNILKKLIDSLFLSTSYSLFNNVIKDINTLEFSKEDEIYIYSYWLYYNAKVGSLLKDAFFNKGIRPIFISRAHRFDIYEEKRKFGFLPQRSEILKSVDKVYACSSNGEVYLKEKYPEFEEKISTGYLGTLDHGIRKYSKHNGFNIVSCSRLTDVKRVNLIIDALKNIDTKDTNITWTHIGGGELFDNFKKYANDSLKNIKFNFIGAIPNTEVYDFYLNNDVDLFINVSNSEGLPVSIMEAISFGIPVVATDVGGTSEIVVNDETGYLLEENFDTKVLSDYILKFANMNNKEYVNFRNNVRKFWEINFQAPNNYKNFCKDLISMIDRSNRIPKQIHYCWFGRGKKNAVFERCINSWKKFLPDYEIIEWNEDNFDVNCNEYIKEAYSKKKYAFVSDYARLKILYDNGGIYFDTDVEVLKSIPDSILQTGYFAKERDEAISTGLGFCVPKHNKAVKIMLDDYKDIHFIKEDGSLDMLACPRRNSKSLTDKGYLITDKCEDIDSIKVYDRNYFCGYDIDNNRFMISNKTYTVHHYDASWLNKKDKKIRDTKKIISKIVGKNNFVRIRKFKKLLFGGR